MPHTMFNLNLAALPNKSRSATSRVRLGYPASANDPGDYFEECEVDFMLGTTSGGRDHPGMRFTVSHQPFTGPFLFQNGNDVMVNGDMAHETGLNEEL